MSRYDQLPPPVSKFKNPVLNPLYNDKDALQCYARAIKGRQRVRTGHVRPDAIPPIPELPWFLSLFVRLYHWFRSFFIQTHTDPSFQIQPKSLAEEERLIKNRLQFASARNKQLEIRIEELLKCQQALTEENDFLRRRNKILQADVDSRNHRFRSLQLDQDSVVARAARELRELRLKTAIQERRISELENALAQRVARGAAEVNF